MTLGSMNSLMTQLQSAELSMTKSQEAVKSTKTNSVETTTDASSSNYTTSSAPQTDVVEISAEGLAACEQMRSSSSSAEADNADSSDLLDSLELSSTTDLSSCTETELRELYLNGEITAAEYKEELASRE